MLLLVTGILIEQKRYLILYLVKKNDPKIIFYPVDGDNVLHEKEMQNNSIVEFREMTKHCKRGNLDEIYSKMLKYHSMYKD